MQRRCDTGAIHVMHMHCGTWAVLRAQNKQMLQRCCSKSAEIALGSEHTMQLNVVLSNIMTPCISHYAANQAKPKLMLHIKPGHKPVLSLQSGWPWPENLQEKLAADW